MQYYWEIVRNGYIGYANYMYNEIINPSWNNYFYWLIGVSIFFFALELATPWVKRGDKLRKDFWLDAFYMFFNFFLFSLVLYNALSMVVVDVFNTSLVNFFGITNVVALNIASLPVWAQLLTLFVIRDFIQWNIHRLLHRSSFLWEFHKVHHSVEEMGFAAHLRYHFAETFVYRTLEYLPLAMIGFGIDDFFIVHIFTLAMGHFNHSNINVPLGPLKYVFNNPQMHIWHHAYEMPRAYGANFGLTLSLWDYIFKTDYVPYEGKGIKLGFKDVASFQGGFWKQVKLPFKKVFNKIEP